MDLTLNGFHHLTAITADAPGNLRFYSKVLGMRLVKKTVNQDDTSAYHLFYADGKASPGTDVTFFDWPAPRERRGTNAIVSTGLRVSDAAALDYWHERLGAHGVSRGSIETIDGRPSLDFEDPEGQRLRLVVDADDEAANVWSGSDVPAEHQIRGLGPIHLSVADPRGTFAVLTQLMNMSERRVYADRGRQTHVFQMTEGGARTELHVRVEPEASPAGQGAGGVHHVAFRAPDTAALTAWTEHLASYRVPSSGEVERYYFRSLYFREPSGILFEIATDGPGFAVDEPMETLGQCLSLPPFLEPRRDEIERRLKPL